MSPIQSSPLYVHLAKRLLRQIAHKSMRPGDFLGTEAELVQKHGVSRVTVRQALLVLERDGYISREKARGTFVKKAVQRQQGLNVARGTVVLACSNEQADHADEDFAFVAVLRAVERNLTQRGYTSQILGFGSDAVADRKRLVELARRDDVEGICTIGPCLEPYQAELPDIPIVTSCTFCPTKSAWVGPDSRDACRVAVQHLMANGHRDIALLCSSQLDREAYGLFVQTFVSTYESAGLTCPRCLMYYAYPGEPLEHLARQMLTGPIRPTAVFAENSKVCQTILSVASDLNLRVPDDLSIVAFGRNALQITYPLAVTAYVPDHDTIGAKAIELLAGVLDGEAPTSRRLEIPGRLVERDSVRSIGPSLISKVKS